MNLAACDNQRNLSEQSYENMPKAPPFILWRLENVKMWVLFLLILRFS